MSTETELTDVTISNQLIYVPVNLSRMSADEKEEITLWCRENFTGEWTHFAHHAYIVNDDDDLIIFKLRWSVFNGKYKR